jgi:hypothetical protein
MYYIKWPQNDIHIYMYIGLRYTQSIKQLTHSLSVYELYELSVHPSVCAIRDSVDDIPSKGCTGHVHPGDSCRL